jgi:hypothetical protein
MSKAVCSKTAMMTGRLTQAKVLELLDSATCYIHKCLSDYSLTFLLQLSLHKC